MSDLKKKLDRTIPEDIEAVLSTPADQQWWCSDDLDGGPATAQRVARAYLKELDKKEKGDERK